jgi:spermidine synthase
MLGEMNRAYPVSDEHLNGYRRNGCRNDIEIRVGIGALGMTSTALQVVVLREFIATADGNELVIGVVLALWMLLTGAGSLLGLLVARRRITGGLRACVLAAFAVLPIVTVFLLRFLRNIVFTRGSTMGLVETVLASLVLLAPYCLIAGLLFAVGASVLSHRNQGGSLAAAYSWESFGSVAGGIVFNIALAAFFNSFEILSILFAIDSAVLCFVFLPGAPPVGGRIALCVALFVPAGMAFRSLDAATRGYLFPEQEILYFHDTPYGNLTITRQGGQRNFFENSVLMFSTDDVASNEEHVHYAMLQHPSPRRVLLIGGSISGATQEILKYGVENVDEVEVNPWILRAGAEFTNALHDGRVRGIAADPRMYVRSTLSRYDVVLLDVPDPSTVQLNRLFTGEFFRDLRRVMNEGAVFSTSLLGATEYQGTEARGVGSVLFATLHRVFSHVLIVPGERNYFLASDRELDIRIGRLAEERGIATTYVNRYYLDDELLKQRSAQLAKGLDSAGAVNSDFRPLCYARQTAYWLSYFDFHPLPWIVAAGVLVSLMLWRVHPVDAGILAAGFTASSIEVILLVSFQVICGSLYQMTGVVVTAFMAGLAVGPLVARFLPRPPTIALYAGIQGVVGGLSILLPVVVLWIPSLDMGLSFFQGLFAAFAFIFGLMGGLEFAIAASVRWGTMEAAASRLYGLDLVGSALGAFLMSVCVIPLYGVMNACLAAGTVSAGGALLSLRRVRRPP